MYAVIKTGGKQYRVQPGDLVVVEKLDGEPGAKVKLDQVLMMGDDKSATLGAPSISGAFASAILVETRKGEKIKIFKKTRRQGYRRTNGHRQMESVLRVTGLTGGDGKATDWDGKVELTTKAEMNARARNLAPRVEAETEATPAKVAKPAAETKAPAKKASPAKAAPKAAAKPEIVDDVSLISGIGPVLKTKLDDEGVTLAKLAKMTPKQMAALDEKLELGGHWETEEWIAQAKDLLAGGAPRARVDQAKVED